MSESTHTTPSTQAQPIHDGIPAAVRATRLYREAVAFGPDHAHALDLDYQRVVCQDLLPDAEYVAGLESWTGDVASYLDEAGLTVPSQAPTTDAAALETVVAATEATQAAEADRVAAARAAAKELLSQAGKAYRRGETAYRDWLLEAGRLASEYVAARLAATDTRKVATDALRGEMARTARDRVDVPGLIKTYHAYRLLSAGVDESAALAVPYGHYRDLYAQLAHREGAGEDSWALLPGIAEAARDYFGRAAAEKLGREAVELRVRELVAAAARHVADQLAAAAAASTDPEEIQDAASARIRADKQQQKADTAARKAAGKPPKTGRKGRKGSSTPVEPTATTQPAPTPPVTPPECQPVGGNILRTIAEESTPANVAEAAGELLTSCSDPDGAIERLLGLLVTHNAVSRATRDVAKTGLQVYARARSKGPSPMDVARNGKAHVGAA